MSDRSAPARSLASPSLGLLLLILIGITAARLIGLYFSAVDLFFDEAQYWAWSRELAFGYFSKPPLLAWTIALADAVCGSAEACVRAPAAVLHMATSFVIYAIARALYDDRRIAFWAALTFALMTGTAFSARIISTDVPLVLFWALALLAYVKLLPGPDLRWALVFGLALGLGLLAKYAMIYVLLGAALAAAFDREARALWQRRDPWIALAIAAALLAPNMWWNAAHGFITFSHTGHNIAGAGLRLNPLQVLEFLGSQFAVFGPIAFAVLLIAFAWAFRPDTPRADRLMLAFALPPLLLIAVMALFTRVNANWAATAFVSAAVAVASLLVRRSAWRWLAASIGIGLAVQAALLVGDAVAYRVRVPLLAKPDAYHRTLGWRALGAETARLLRAGGAGRPAIATVVAEGRADVATLLYYLRDAPVRVLAWPTRPRGRPPADHFELTRALNAQAATPILLVSRCGNPRRLEKYYAQVTRLGAFAVASGPTSSRGYYAFRLDGVKGEVGPLGGCGS